MAGQVRAARRTDRTRRCQATHRPASPHSLESQRSYPGSSAGPPCPCPATSPRTGTTCGKGDLWLQRWLVLGNRVAGSRTQVARAHLLGSCLCSPHAGIPVCTRLWHDMHSQGGSRHPLEAVIWVMTGRKRDSHLHMSLTPKCHSRAYSSIQRKQPL